MAVLIRIGLWQHRGSRDCSTLRICTWWIGFVFVGDSGLLFVCKERREENRGVLWGGLIDKQLQYKSSLVGYSATVWHCNTAVKDFGRCCGSCSGEDISHVSTDCYKRWVDCLDHMHVGDLITARFWASGFRLEFSSSETCQFASKHCEVMFPSRLSVHVSIVTICTCKFVFLFYDWPWCDRLLECQMLLFNSGLIVFVQLTTFVVTTSIPVGGTALFVVPCDSVC